MKENGTVGKMAGSYTVEAAWVMAAVLFAIVSVIRFAYGMHDETKGAMVLQESVEKLRHGEELSVDEVRSMGIKRAGHMYSFEAYGLELSKDKKHVTGSASGGRWRLDLSMGTFNPEGFLRMWSLLEDKEQEGR